MRSENITDMIENLRKEVIENIVLKHIPEKVIIQNGIQKI